MDNSISHYLDRLFGYQKMERAEHISRRLKLRQLEVLIAVAQSGNMAKAAGQLAITQPVVSKTIADLEKALGVRLFDRDRRGVALTPYGQALLKRSIAVFNDLRIGVTELELMADPSAGELRIGSSDAVASGMVGAIIDKLRQRHPRLTFEVTLGGGLTDLQHRELQSHALDLIIGRLPLIVPDDLEATILYQERMMLVTAAQTDLVRAHKVRLAQLVDMPWCLPPLESHPWTLIADAFRRAGLDLPRRIVTTRSIQVLNSLVATGGYLSFLPRNVLHYCAENLSLRTWPIGVSIQPYPVGIVTLKNRTVNPATKLFIECAREIAKPLAKDRK
jgi:DNA-binding transcriptional LysR family regulator